MTQRGATIISLAFVSFLFCTNSEGTLNVKSGMCKDNRTNK